jgi:hypothetical protein
MSQQTVDDLVAAWFAGDCVLWDACWDEPETAWLTALEIMKRDLTPNQTAYLAAGVIEQLLAWHGARFIDRVEMEAKDHLQFRYLLRHVWQNTAASGYLG